MKKISELIAKIKSSKNAHLIIALVLCAVAALTFFVTSAQKSTVSDGSTDSFYAYNEQMENKLCNVISSLKGVGRTTVAITYQAGAEKIYAYETKKQTSGGVSTETQSLITVSGQPLVTKELAPLICGVIVVAEGAENPVVRMKITEIVVTLLSIDSSKVQVMS